MSDAHSATPPATPVPPGDAPALLAVRDLETRFPAHAGLLRRATGWVRAVDGVSFDIGRAESLGLVGESGCGKTTVGRTVLRLIPASAGSVKLAGEDVLTAAGPALRALRRRMQIIFQDPAGSLNPRMRVGAIVGEPLSVHGVVRDRDELRARVATLLERCGMPRAAADRYPHEFSGGQRQRVGIARALALNPAFIVCDEPTSALDVSIQAQILNLLKDLQQDLGLSYLFISHDIAVVRHMCHRIAVMLRGKIVESGPRDRVVESPEHPYTRALLSAVPVPKTAERRSRGTSSMNAS